MSLLSIPAVRLTIARKIALAVAAIVILSIGTMAWLINANLQRGFIAYLNDMQAQDLDQVSILLAERYKREGDFEWLRHRPRAMKEVLDLMAPQLQMEPDAPGRGGRGGPDGGPDGRPDDRADDRAERRPDGRPEPRRGPPRRNAYGPDNGNDAGDNAGRGDVRDGPPGPPRGDEGGGYRAPRPAREEGGDRAGPPPRDGGRNAYGPPRRQAPPPRPRVLQDPMAFAARLTVKDEYGESLVGPPDPPPGIVRPIMVDGRKVGTVQLLQLRQASGQATAASFLRNQTRDILLLAGALLLMAMALAVGLARHMLRPVAALHGVTARLARGELSARAPVLSRDELGELALHVNGMAQELERNEQLRRQMLADVSHELRTPLTVIRGEIEALLDGVRKADPAALESLHGEVLRLTKLVDDLHQLALADTGDMHFEMRPLELQPMLLPLLERYRPRAADAGLPLRWDLPPQPVMIEGDARRLEQVVVNLLENSIRYTDRGGIIMVALKTRHDGRQGQAELTVDDSAPGVPAGAHARLFERLYRVDQARTRERGGSGLGLAICKAVVEAHGGVVAALPSEHGGVRIRVTLPLLQTGD